MEITWTVDSAEWTASLIDDITADPAEIATQCLELALDQKPQDFALTDLGLVMFISHDGMKDESEHLLVMTHLIVANAGLHSEAETMKNVIDAEFPEE